MAETAWAEQLAASADNLNGDATSAFSAGLLTVTPANAGTARVAIKDDEIERSLTMFIGFL
jgi:hypothetical protein